MAGLAETLNNPTDVLYLSEIMLQDSAVDP